MLSFLGMIALAACGRAATDPGASPAPTLSVPMHVLVTISTFVSLVQAVGGDRVAVSSFVPPGASPEDYQPTPADIAKVHAADVLFENGLGLETWLARSIDDAGNSRLRVVVLSDGLPNKDGNPHLWMDPVGARAYVRKIRDALSAADPAGRAVYAKNAAAYDRVLVTLQADIAEEIGTIPPDARSMIVFHNAWQYFDDRFGLRTVGVVELSPGQEPNPQYVSNLIDLARRHHVRAVFAEPEYSPKLVESLAQSAGITTIQNLYDDSIGTNPAVRTYQSMLRYDAATIVKALGGRA